MIIFLNLDLITCALLFVIQVSVTKAILFFESMRNPFRLSVFLISERALVSKSDGSFLVCSLETIVLGISFETLVGVLLRDLAS